MTVLSKSALIAKTNSLIPDNTTEEVSPMDVRSVLFDIIDSLALQTAVDGLPGQRTGAEIVTAINTQLGNAGWQQPPGQVTGVTLAQAIAAVLIDAAPVEHVRLTRTATTTSVTIGLEVVDHTRKVIVSADTTLDGGDLETESETQHVVVPGGPFSWPNGDLRYIFVGVPTGEADVTNIQSGGISVFGAYQAVSTVYDGHKWWRTTDAQDGEFARGVTLTIVQ